MNKLLTLGFLLICYGCFLKDNCYDTQADPIPEYDKSFLPYTTDNVYYFKELNSNNIIAFVCDTTFEFWQSMFMDGDCDFYAYTNTRKVILSSTFNNNEDRITINSSIVSSKFPKSFSSYIERNNCRELLIDIHYTDSIVSSDYHYSSYIVKSSPDLSFYNSGSASADSSIPFYEVKTLNGRTYNEVNELLGLNTISHSWSDTLYINHEFGILKFHIREINYDLILNN